MFTSYYDLESHPFQRAPEVRFYFDNRERQKDLRLVQERLSTGGITVVMGEEGMGKTMLLELLMTRLDPSVFSTAKLTTLPRDPKEVPRAVALAFGLECQDDNSMQAAQRLGELLVDLQRAGTRPVLFIDDAEELTDAAQEELKWLLELGAHGEPPLHILILGRPELGRIVSGDIGPLASISDVAAYHLQPLDDEETRHLIKHRLRVSGWQGHPFISKAAFEFIFLKTGGVPGKIVEFCAALLEDARRRQLRSIGGNEVKKVAAPWRTPGETARETAGEIKERPETPEQPAGQAEQPGFPPRRLAFKVPEPERELADQDTFPITLEEEPTPEQPPRWRKALPYAQYAAAIVLALIIAWNAAGPLMEWTKPTASAPQITATVALPETEEDVPAPEPAEPGPVVQAEQRSDDPSEPEPAIAAESAAPIPEAPLPPSETPIPAAEVPAATLAPVEKSPAPERYIVDLGEKLAGAQMSEAPETTEIPVFSAPEPPFLDKDPVAEKIETAIADANRAEAVASKPQEAKRGELTGAIEIAGQQQAAETSSDSKIAATADSLSSPDKTEDLGPAQDPKLAAKGPDASPSATEAAETETPKPAAISTSEPVQVATTESDLAVTELTLTRDVVEREPVDATEVFSVSDQRAYAFARVKNPGGQTKVTFVWYLDDATHTSAEMKVGTSAAWRTWSLLVLEPGSWRVEVKDESGQVLANRAFTVE
jgi:type II secretory pathway predicted ATPase ExeA